MNYDVLHNFISPVTGRVYATPNYVLLGDKAGIATPSPIIIDIRLDIQTLQEEIELLKPQVFPKDVAFIIQTPDIRVPNAQALSDLGDGILKVNTGGILSVAVENIDYITKAYLDTELLAYVKIVDFPGLFTSNYTPAITASLSTYTATVLPVELATFNTVTVIPETTAAIAAALVAYTTNTLNPAIDGLTLNLTGAVLGSGLLNTTINTTLEPNITIPGNEAMIIPIGSNSERPNTPSMGMIRYNNEIYAFEQWDGTGNWKTPLTSLFGTSNQISINTVIGQPDKLSLSLVDNVYLYGTGFLKIPSGTTAERPIETYVGMIRFNTTLGTCEQYNGNEWLSTNGAGTITSITINTSGSGLNINDSSAITTAGIRTLYLSDELQAINDLSVTGIPVFVGSQNGYYTTRSIQAGVGINITNGDGVNDNPSIALENTGIINGTYSYPTSLSVNEQGQLTAATAGPAPIINLASGSPGQLYVTPGTQYPTIYFADNVALPGNESVTIPTGTTAERPTSPSVGMIRINTDL